MDTTKIRGRKPLATEEARTNKVMACFSWLEFAALKQRMKISGYEHVSVSAYLRACALGHEIKSVVVPEINREAAATLAAIAADLNRLGSGADISDALARISALHEAVVGGA